MFTPIKNTTVSEKVVEQIKDMLSKGNLNKGDRLPSERQMAETLEVSRSSVREALRELEMIGLIAVSYTHLFLLLFKVFYLLWINILPNIQNISQ